MKRAKRLVRVVLDVDKITLTPHRDLPDKDFAAIVRRVRARAAEVEREIDALEPVIFEQVAAAFRKRPLLGRNDPPPEPPRPATFWITQ